MWCFHSYICIIIYTDVYTCIVLRAYICFYDIQVHSTLLYFPLLLSFPHSLTHSLLPSLHHSLSPSLSPSLPPSLPPSLSCQVHRGSEGVEIISQIGKATVTYDPLQIEISVNGEIAVILNSRGLFNFEYYRKKRYIQWNLSIMTLVNWGHLYGTPICPKYNIRVLNEDIFIGTL